MHSAEVVQYAGGATGRALEDLTLGRRTLRGADLPLPAQSAAPVILAAFRVVGGERDGTVSVLPFCWATRMKAYALLFSALFFAGVVGADFCFGQLLKRGYNVAP